MSDPNNITITPSWPLLEQPDGIINQFVKIVVKITSVDLPDPIEQTFADGPTRGTGNDFDIIRGAKVHQEAALYYQNLLGLHSYPPDVQDFIAGLSGYPRRLRVAFEGICTLAKTIRVICTDIVSMSGGPTPANGIYTLSKTDDGWALDHESEGGAIIQVSCEDGLYSPSIAYNSGTIFVSSSGSNDMNAPQSNTSPGSGTITVVP